MALLKNLPESVPFILVCFWQPTSILFLLFESLQAHQAPVGYHLPQFPSFAPSAVPGLFPCAGLTALSKANQNQGNIIDQSVSAFKSGVQRIGKPRNSGLVHGSTQACCLHNLDALSGNSLPPGPAPHSLPEQSQQLPEGLGPSPASLGLTKSVLYPLLDSDLLSSLKQPSPEGSRSPSPICVAPTCYDKQATLVRDCRKPDQGHCQQFF